MKCATERKLVKSTQRLQFKKCITKNVGQKNLFPNTWEGKVLSSMKIKDKNFLIHLSEKHTQHNAIYIQDEYNSQEEKLKYYFLRFNESI